MDKTAERKADLSTFHRMFWLYANNTVWGENWAKQLLNKYMCKKKNLSLPRILKYLESKLLLGPECVVPFSSRNLCRCASASNMEKPVTPVSPLLSLSRWSWQEAASLTMSTLGTTWRWQSSWAWSSRLGGVSSPRAPQRTQPVQPLPPLSQRPPSQVGIANPMCLLLVVGGQDLRWLSVLKVPVWRDYK